MLVFFTLRRVASLGTLLLWAPLPFAWIWVGGRVYAVTGSLLADEAYRARFLREARLATQIHHPNIAVVHDFFLGDGGSYLVTEYIDGSTVRQWNAAYGAFPIAVAVRTPPPVGTDTSLPVDLAKKDESFPVGFPSISTDAAPAWRSTAAI